MKFRARKTIKIGPVRINLTQRGFSSWGLAFGRYRWNSRRGHTYDTPGLGHVQWGRPKRQVPRRGPTSDNTDYPSAGAR